MTVLNFIDVLVTLGSIGLILVVTGYLSKRCKSKLIWVIAFLLMNMFVARILTFVIKPDLMLLVYLLVSLLGAVTAIFFALVWFQRLSKFRANRQGDTATTSSKIER